MPQDDANYAYDDLFYGYQRDGSARSASVVIPRLLQALGVESVLDIGCGAGAWLREYQRAGVNDVIGVDGDYVNRNLLLVDGACFSPRDITKSFSFGRTFGLVQ